MPQMLHNLKQESRAMLHIMKSPLVANHETNNRMSKPKFPNNLLRLRKQLNLTQEEIAKVWDATRADVSRIESGQVGISVAKRKKLLEVFGWTASQLLEEDSAQVPVLGIIGAGGAISPFDDYPKMRAEFREHQQPDDPMETVEAPPGESHHGLIALRVDGDSMRPFYKSGDIIYYSRHHSNPKEMLNERCVVCTTNGMMAIKILRRGAKYGVYDLESYNAEVMHDQAVEWVAKILFSKHI